MSDYQLGIYENARMVEREQERKNANNKKQSSNKEDDIHKQINSTYRIFSRLFCNFVYPEGIERPLKSDDKAVDIEGKEEDEITEDDIDIVNPQELVEGADTGKDADDVEKIRTKVSSEKNKRYYTALMRSFDFLEKNKEKYFNKAALQIYSPKFLTMFENIEDEEHKGIHLVYSQFRTIEGIGLFQLVLKQNGFAQFKIKRSSSGAWTLDIKEDDIEKPKYVLYTGTETAEEKEIVRNILNGDWSKIPKSLVHELTSIHPNNLYGEVIKVIMITSSGSEGITLKNVRYVHLMEPYWHPVRGEQVIGRARRIRSHDALPEEERTVEVFQYLMVLSEEQLDPGNDVSQQIRLHDRSKIDGITPLTTDQSLHEISTIKKKFNTQLLMAIKESSIDCITHMTAKSKESIKCFQFTNPKSSAISYTGDYTTQERDSDTKMNKKVEKSIKRCYF